HVIEVPGRQRGDPVGKFEGFWMAELESRGVIKRCCFALDGRDNRLASVTGMGAPQAGRAVEQLAAVAGDVMHVLGADDEPWPFFEGPVCRERHPIGFEVVWNRDFCLCHEPVTIAGAMPGLIPGHDGIQRCCNGPVCYVDLKWPTNPASRPNSRPVCRAAWPTEGRARSRPRGTWWMRSVLFSSGMASNRWKRLRSSTPTRWASSFPTRIGRMKGFSRFRMTMNNGSRCATT